ncbi:MAG: Fic family protein [bacterium]|nr:Fic family protein [bacterium]
MKIEIGKFVSQPRGYKSFVTNPFPPKGIFGFPAKTLVKADKATRLVGKLDGVTHELPDVDFFLYMFIIKDAEASSQIEGTKATIVDVLEANAGIAPKETDSSDIDFYIEALNYGIVRIKKLPLSLRFIRELHSKLMTGARATHFSDPGNFRNSQNWIGGATLSDASYVPPAVTDMNPALSDLEKFLHNEEVLPLIQAAIAHAQFETIHPFLDGNGRTGRLLITLLLLERKLLDKPVLFLSWYFKKHQKVYYQKLGDYHDGKVDEWVNFFLDGVIETAEDSIRISKKIFQLREEDMCKIHALGKREAESGILVLRNLFKMPIINSRIVMGWTGFTRAGSIKLIERFVSLGILIERKTEGKEKVYSYVNYLKAFTRDNK